MAPPNVLPLHGNEKTMNLNPMILTNIQSSPYFKVKLYELKTYHEVVDEIYFKVQHLEPWEKGSRKTAGQTGMCGGVRGVGAGGIVSSAFCLLYKLFTLRLTRKQLMGLLTHQDSVYIRALGFMYIRYTQPPADFWEWYKPYLDDEEEIDVKAGGGHMMTVGEMLRTWLSKLEWYSTLFPRIPVPIQKSLNASLGEWEDERQALVLEAAAARRAMGGGGVPGAEGRGGPGEGDAGAGGAGAPGHGDPENHFGEAERVSNLRNSPSRKQHGDPSEREERDGRRDDRDARHGSSRHHSKHRSRSRERDRKRSSRSVDRERDRERERRRSRERGGDRGGERGAAARRSRSRERRRSRSPRHERRHSRERKRSRSRDRHERRRSRSRERHRHRSRSKERGVRASRERVHRSRSRDKHHKESSFERDLRREKDRQKHKKEKHRDREREKHRGEDE